LVLRKQLAAYIERGIKPQRLDHAGRVSLAVLPRLFSWRDAIVMVRPFTVIGKQSQPPFLCDPSRLPLYAFT